MKSSYSSFMDLVNKLIDEEAKAQTLKRACAQAEKLAMKRKLVEEFKLTPQIVESMQANKKLLKELKVPGADFEMMIETYLKNSGQTLDNFLKKSPEKCMRTIKKYKPVLKKYYVIKHGLERFKKADPELIGKFVDDYNEIDKKYLSGRIEKMERLLKHIELLSKNAEILSDQAFSRNAKYFKLNTAFHLITFGYIEIELRNLKAEVALYSSEIDNHFKGSFKEIVVQQKVSNYNLIETLPLSKEVLRMKSLGLKENNIEKTNSINNFPYVNYSCNNKNAEFTTSKDKVKTAKKALKLSNTLSMFRSKEMPYQETHRGRGIHKDHETHPGQEAHKDREVHKDQEIHQDKDSTFTPPF